MAKFEKGNPGGPGRPRGSKNRTTIEREAVEAEMLQAMLPEAGGNEMPKEFMLRIMRCGALSLEMRFAAARSVAQYCHPQLQAMAHQILDSSGAPIVPQINVQIMAPPVDAPKLTHEGPKDGESVQ